MIFLVSIFFSVPEEKTEWAKLGSCASSQRKKTDGIYAYRRTLLNDLGFEWDVTTEGKRNKAWNEKLVQLKKFKADHGHLNVLATDPTSSSLADWITRQRYSYQQLWDGKYSPLNEERIRLLNQLEFSWTHQITNQSTKSKSWDNYFATLIKYKEVHGHCNVPRGHHGLGNWVDEQRLAIRELFTGKKSSMTWEHFSRLESLGFEFSVRSSVPFQEVSIKSDGGISPDEF